MELISAISMMITMSVVFSLLTARYVRNQERRLAVKAIDTLIDSLQEALPEFVIRKNSIPANNSTNYPYDWRAEEAFDNIIKHFDK
jgi:hypothetical protein